MDKRAEMILEPGIEKYMVPASDPRWGPSYVPIHSRSFEKLASECYVPAKLIKLIETLKPRKEGRYVHINAVGALHAWGSNSNGDAFPKWSLLHDEPPADVLAFLREKSLVVPAEYGHQTFETYAYPFVFHDNKDPLASIGERVTCAAYNDQMERVELIVFLLESRAPDLVRRVDAGDPIPWSMGCKVPFDVCSICKNAAKNRSEYCSHLRTLMNVTLPDGRKVYALNWFPKFFDISYVISPAWKEAWSLRKIACAGSPTMAVPLSSTRDRFALYEPDFMKIASAQSRFQKAAVLKRAEEKAAEIEKQVPAEKGQDNLGTSPIKPPVYRELKKLVSMHESGTSAIPGLDMSVLKNEPLSDVLGGATACGIQLRKPEIEDLTDGDASKLPESLDFESPSSRIMSVLKKWIPERSLFDPPFAKRVIRIIRISRSPESGVEKRSSGSAAYDRYCELLRKIDVNKLAAKANELEILEARDPSAVDQSLVAVKTAEVDERFRAVMPFVVGAGLNRG